MRPTTTMMRLPTTARRHAACDHFGGRMALLTARLAILGQLDAIVPALEDLLAPDDGRRLAIGPQGGQVRLDRRERGATAGFQHDRRRTVRPVLDERIVAEAAEILRTHERVRRQRCVGDVRRFAREVEPEQLDRSATDDVIAERHLAVGMDRRAEAGATIAVLISAVAAARRGAARELLHDPARRVAKAGVDPRRRRTEQHQSEQPRGHGYDAGRPVAPTRQCGGARRYLLSLWGGAVALRNAAG